jgi:CRISPR-associated protein Cmr6
VHWFHKNYYKNKTIKGSILTGKFANIGRIWHRMYPRFIQIDNEDSLTNEYIELLTIFPDQSQQTKDFLKFLDKHSEFERCW